MWISEHDMFVADVGTEKITMTLSFPTGKEFKMETRSEMPSHPATYMNPDGQVDIIPGRTTEFVRTGTYTRKKGKVVLQETDGPVQELLLEGNVLRADGFFGDEPCIFVKRQ